MPGFEKKAALSSYLVSLHSSYVLHHHKEVIADPAGT
jgi:hypothetical protein